jgi:hypothetical protein
MQIVNADCVAVGIENHRHAANRSDERLGTKPDLVGAKVFNGLVEVFHLQGRRAAVRTWFPIGCRADSQSVRPEFVLNH